MSKKHTLKKHLLYYILIALFSLVPLDWFKGKTMGSGDFGNSIAFENTLLSIDSSWRSDINTGREETSLMLHVPLSLFYLPLVALGFPSLSIQQFWSFIFNFLCGFFMYSFLYTFTRKKVPEPIIFVASIFYLYNPITLISPIFLNYPKSIVHMALPLMALLLVLLLEAKTEKQEVIHGTALSASTLFLSGAFLNIAETAPIFIVLGAIVAFMFLAERIKMHKAIILITVFLLSFLLNFWWINSSFYAQFTSKGDSIESLGNFNKTTSKAVDVLRLFGYWALRSRVDDVPYYSFGDTYYTREYMGLTYIIPVLVLLPILLLQIKNYDISSKDRYRVIFGVTAFLLGVFIVKAAGNPLGGWYKYLFENVPAFRIFREPYKKFSLITLFSACIGITYSLLLIEKTINKKVKYAAFGISILFVCYIRVVTFPMFDGQIVRKMTYGPMKGMSAQIPDYWEELAEKVNQEQTDDRILLLPEISYKNKSFLWKEGHNGNPADLLLNKTTTFYPTQAFNDGDKLVKELYDSLDLYLREGNEEDLAKVISLMRDLDIGYILQMNDFDWVSIKDYDHWSGANIDRFIQNDMDQYIESIDEFGLLSEKYLLSIPHVKGGDSIIRVEDSPTTQDFISGFAGRAALKLYKMNDKFTKPKIYTSNVTDNTLTIEYKEITPSRYKVKIPKQQNNDISITFQESYDNGWFLSKKCDVFGCRSSIEAQHTEDLSYANKWTISPGNQQEEFFIAHKSTNRLVTGIAISAFTMASLISGYIYYMWSTRKVN